MGIYVASKIRHAPKWISYRDRGYPITSTWIDQAGEGESLDLRDLWVRCVREAGAADVVVLYPEPGNHLKGALVEVGAALGNRVPVIVVGEADGSWVRHPLVQKSPDLDTAMFDAKFLVETK